MITKVSRVISYIRSTIATPNTHNCDLTAQKIFYKTAKSANNRSTQNSFHKTVNSLENNFEEYVLEQLNESTMTVSNNTLNNTQYIEDNFPKVLTEIEKSVIILKKFYSDLLKKRKTKSSKLYSHMNDENEITANVNALMANNNNLNHHNPNNTTNNHRREESRALPKIDIDVVMKEYQRVHKKKTKDLTTLYEFYTNEFLNKSTKSANISHINHSQNNINLSHNNMSMNNISQQNISQQNISHHISHHIQNLISMPSNISNSLVASQQLSFLQMKDGLPHHNTPINFDFSPRNSKFEIPLPPTPINSNRTGPTPKNYLANDDDIQFSISKEGITPIKSHSQSQEYADKTPSVVMNCNE